MCGSIGLLVDVWVVFGVVVCPIVAAFVPVVMESMVEILGIGATMSKDP